MSLLRYDRKRSAKHLREFTVLRCPANGHQVSWCRGLCQPVAGNGTCGRPAPHLMISRTQAAIAQYLEARGGVQA